MPQSSNKIYPFAAIVGQEDLKLCLILCAIDPTIGGVLIRGDKGTAKSTAARGLARLLPRIKVGYNPESEAFDPYNRDGDDVAMDKNGKSSEIREIPTPFVDLPIGATEDRVLGSLDFSATLQKSGKRVFAPGLLAAANRGILYIDEVNLLPAHLVDVLYVEHHVHFAEMKPIWRSSARGTLQTTLELFTALRQKGVAAHYWP